MLLKKINKFKISEIATFIVIFLLSLTPLLWFLGKGDVLINGIDTNFPLDPLVWFKRRFFVWNEVANGGSDFSSSTAGLFFHLVQVIPFLLRASLQTTQIISLIFWFSLIIISSYLFARTIFSNSKLAQILFVIFYAFNIYLFNSWENVKVANLSLMAALPFALNILTLLIRKKISLKLTALFSLLTGIIVSGTGINPSYFITFFLILLIYFLGELFSETGKLTLFNKSKGFLFISLCIILVNLFWILPTSNFIFKNVSAIKSIDKIGFNNWIDSLSENTSIFNIMRLQGAWDWYTLDSNNGLPLYIPYATRYFYSLPFLIFSIVPASLALVSLIFRNKKKKGLYLSFSVMLLVGIFLDAGTHLPTGSVFKFILNHLPFFSLFRSPWYIFTPLITLSYAGLIGLLFYNLNIKFISKQQLINLGLASFAVILIIGNLFYSYPLLTGKIFRPARPDGFYINFPSYVFETEKWLSKKTGGRIITYPDDEIEKFDWGYRGIESILQLIVERDVLFSPLNASDSPVSLLVKQLYQNLRKEEIDGMESIAAKLNVSLIFHKEDQPSLAPDLPDRIKSLSSAKFGKWSFYNLQNNMVLPKIYFAENLLYSYPYNKNTKIFSALGKGDQVVNPDDQVVKSISQISNFSGLAILTRNLQLDDYMNFSTSDSKLSNRLVTRDFSKVDYEFEIPEDSSYEPKLERYRVEDFGINTTGDIKVNVNGKPESWTIDKVTDSYIIFKSHEFKKGKHRVSLKLKDNNLITGGDFENGEEFKRGGHSEGAANYEIKEDATGKFLSLYNLGTTEQSADFTTFGFNPFIPYYVEIRYKQIYGNNAQVIAEQNTSTTLVKAQIERMPNYPEWQKFSFYYQPVETKSEMRIFLTAPYTKDPLGTKIFYDDLTVKKVFTNNLLLIKKSQTALVSPKIDFQKKSPVGYEGIVQGANGPHLIIFSENYSPDWEIKLTDLQGIPINFTKKHFSINLYANGWFFDSLPSTYKFKIYYRPQNLFYLGAFISGLTILISLLLIFRDKMLEKRLKSEKY